MSNLHVAVTLFRCPNENTTLVTKLHLKSE